ncbi:beta strand repeat-containing protein [Halorubrum rutilum]|uniref:Probable pectate lyase C n=1 Tax=Halorubrum rutilum TaxID=1364933 RepID=A0ABD6ARJ3_9EURY|nr:surface glycoprotein [Halorubrum rutilum]
MTGGQKNIREKFGAVFFAFVMVTSMVAIGGAAFAGTAAAQSFAESGSGSPVDIAGNNADTSQKLVADSGNNIDITGLSASGDQDAIRISLSELENAGADLSDVTISDVNAGTGTVNFQNVDAEDEEIQLVVTDDGSGNIVIDSLELSGIGTSGVSTASGLRYTIRVDDGNSGDFNTNFETAAISQTPTFSIATVEVENIDTGTVVTESSLSNAIDEANNPTDLDGEASDQIEIRPGSGTYTIDTALDINADNTRITADGADVTFENNGAAPTLQTDNDGVEVSDITFDQAGNANDAIVVNDDAQLTVSGSNFTDPGAPFIDADVGGGADDALTLEDNTFEGNDQSVDGVQIVDSDEGLELTVTGNTFTNLNDAVQTSESGAFRNVADFSGNTFESNSYHISDIASQYGDVTGDPSLDLSAIFQNNEFDQTAVTVDEDGQTVRGQAGGLILGIGGDTLAGSAFADGDVGVTPEVTTSGEYTIELSEGDFTQTSQLRIGAQPDAVTVQGAGADTTNVTLASSSGGPSVQLGTNTDTDTVSDVTIDGLTLINDDNSNSEGTIAEGSGDNLGTLNGLTVSNVDFEAAGGDTVVDLTGASTINDIELSNNGFEAVDPSNDDYNAIDLGDNLVGEDATVTVDSNTINGTVSSAFTGIDLAGVNDDGAAVEITDNEIVGVNYGTGITATANTVQSLVVSGNTILGADDSSTVGTTLTGISVDSTDQGDSVEVTENDISGLTTSNHDSIGLVIADEGTGATVQDNTFDNNDVHIDFDADVGAGDGASNGAEALESDNEFNSFVYITSNEEDDFTNSLVNTQRIYGTVGGGVGDVGVTGSTAGDYVQVRPGTYVESGVGTGDNAGANVVSTGSADETVLTTDAESTILAIDSGHEVDGFTFQSTTDSAQSDVTISGGADAQLLNSTLEGAGTTDRVGITISDSEGDTTEVSNVTVSNYATGITVSGVTGSATVQDSVITGSETGVTLQSGLGESVQLVRNEIAGNTLGVNIQDTGDNDHVIHFNDIVSNEVGVEFADASAAFSAKANWWGSEDGPTITEETGADADILVSNTDNLARTDAELRPWLTSSYTELPQDRMVVVTDPTAPPADATGGEGALVLVAVLDDDLAGQSNVNPGSTTFVVDGPDTLIDTAGSEESLGQNAVNGQLSAVSPLLVPDGTDGDGSTATFGTDSIVPQSDTPGDYEIQAVNTEDAVDSGSAVQQFSGAVADVNVTTDTTNLAADGETTANVTLQLVDSDGNPVPRSLTDGDISWSIDNNQAAGVERVSADTNTDANGQATLTVTAETAGETFTVTGIDGSNNNADNVEISTVEPAAANLTLDLVEGPTTITQNESFSATLNVTNVGDAATTQDITYDLEDETGISQLSASQEVSLDAGNSTEITFEVPASATAGLDTGNYTHVFASDNDELTVDAEVVAPTDSPLDGAAGEFDDDGDGTITASELGDAVNAFGQGNLTAAELGDVVNAFGQS